MHNEAGLTTSLLLLILVLQLVVDYWRRKREELRDRLINDRINALHAELQSTINYRFDEVWGCELRQTANIDLLVQAVTRVDKLLKERR